MIDSILVVDDHDIVFTGIKLMLLKGDIAANVNKAKNGSECLSNLMVNKYELIILDVNLPDTDTQSLVNIILSNNPKQKILIFSMSPEHLYAIRFLKLGVYGYINKNEDSDELLKAIKNVLNGKKYISSYISELLTTELKTTFLESPIDLLTDREFEIMELLLKGYRNKEISNILNLHASSIATYKNRLYTKLKVTNVVELGLICKLYKN